MRSRLTSAVALVALALLGAVYTIVSGNSPLLGLDLQGGVSVVLQPVTETDEETLDQTVEIIRNRVDGLGVAEPEISRQGQNIVVDLPGVEEQQRALALVGQTAELRFRPVILGPNQMGYISVGSDDSDSSDSDSSDSDSTETDSTETDSSETGAADSEESLAPFHAKQNDADETVDGESVAEETDAVEDDVVVEDTTSDDATTGENPDDDDVDPEELPLVADSDTLAELPEEEIGSMTPVQMQSLTTCALGTPFTPEEDLADEYVILTDPSSGGVYCLGPTLLKGDALESAEPGFDQSQWFVSPTFLAGEDGIDAFNAVAAICAQPSLGNNNDICPDQGNGRGALAIVLDHEVLSAPTINASSFSRDNITISGSFTEDEARNLALALNYGALPVELEALQTRTVSATIGDDVLRSGVIAGVIGLLLVAVYVLAYYRLAGLVAIGGLILSGLMLWTVVAWFGETQGLAITLAGIVGLIVSIGVSADSNIVYFENVKDLAVGGKRVATSVERAYESAISTILKADTVSLIAAVLLYFLTVGAVRGFAFYLGLATLLDLLVSYMFMRPALAWLANTQRVKDNPMLLGIPEGDDQ